MFSCVLAFVLFTSISSGADSPKVFTVAATNNGTVDVSGNIQATLDAAAAAYNNMGEGSGWHSGVTVVFPAGSYLIGTRLVMRVQGRFRQGGIMIRGEGSGVSKIICRATSANSVTGAGALLIEPTRQGEVDLNIQIEDLGFKADAAIDGPAIEIAPTTQDLYVIPRLRNIQIDQKSSMKDDYFTHGVKMKYVDRSVFNNVTINLSRVHTTAGIYLENSYQFKMTDSLITGAQKGIWHQYGGEGGALTRSVFSDVLTGIYMFNGADALMSASGFNIANNTITAREAALDVTKKSFLNISNNTFKVDTLRSQGYQGIVLTSCNQGIVSGNTFESISGSRGTGVVLNNGSGTSSIMVCDNTFASLVTAVNVGSGVTDTMVFNNRYGTDQSPMTPPYVIGSGTSTRNITGGTPRTMTLPLADKAAGASFSWADWTSLPKYDVTHYGANGTSANEDTTAIEQAIGDAVDYINDPAHVVPKAVLYFPAGDYITATTLTATITRSGGVLYICGDGKGVSAIEGGGPGIFSINTPSGAGVDIHNLILIPRNASGGPAISVTNTGGLTSARTLFVHDVIFGINEGTNNPNGKFSSAIAGMNLYNTLLQDLWIEFNTTADKGIALTGGSGFRCERVRIKGEHVPADTDPVLWDGVQTGIDVNNTAGEVIIGSGAILESKVGIKVVSANGTVKLQAEHLNCVNVNLDVSNAAEAVYTMSEHLNQDGGVDYIPGGTNVQASSKFTNCGKVDVCYAFHHVATRFSSLGRKSVWLSGNANRNGSIYANMFSEKAGTNIQIDTGSVATTEFNRFLRTEVLDSNTTPGSTASPYPLNGQNGELYVLRNKANGNYLGANGTTAACSGNLFQDSVKWSVVYDQNAAAPYTFKKKSSNNYLQNTAGIVNCVSTSAADSSAQWQIVNLGNSTYSIQKDTNLLASTTTGNLTLVPTPSQETQWEILLASDIAEMMDMTSFSTNSTTGGWKTLAFHKRFPNPPAVFLGTMSNNDPTPAVAGIKNITSASCDFGLFNWSDYSAHGNEDIHLLAVPKGTYGSGALQFDAGTLIINASGNATTTEWVTHAFSAGTFASPPVVFVQPLERAGVGAATIAQIRNVTSTSFEVRLQKSNTAQNWRQTHNVDYIAISQGPTNRCITGAWESATSGNMTFTEWDSSPAVPGFVGSVSIQNTTDTLIPPYLLRHKAGTLTADGVAVVLQSLNGTTSTHTKRVGWVLFENDP